MEKLSPIVATYQNIISETEQELSKLKQRIYRIGTLRLMLFVAGVVGIIHFWSLSNLIIAGIAAITFLPFLFLMKLHNRLFYRKEYLEKRIEINRQELQAMNYDTATFDGGSEFIDPSHLYSYDLDVFGERSLFQYINRTSTELGKKRLAAWFNSHLETKADIEKRQEAVRELAPELGMRQHFRVLGLLYKGKLADEKEINSWATSPSYYRKRAVLRALPIIVSAINTVLITLAIAGILPANLAGLAFVSFFLLSIMFSKGISKMQNLYGKQLQILATYARLIRIIEEKQMHSQALKEIKELVNGRKQTASQAVQNLTALMNALDQRNNMMMAAVLNGLFFWELRQIMQIEAWKEKHAPELSRWLTAIGQMDAYCSLAAFAYNHPDYIYPQITTHPFNLQAQAMGHPLMHREDRKSVV